MRFLLAFPFLVASAGLMWVAGKIMGPKHREAFTTSFIEKLAEELL